MEIIPLNGWQYYWKINCANSNPSLIPTAHSVHKYRGESPLTWFPWTSYKIKYCIFDSFEELWWCGFLQRTHEDVSTRAGAGAALGSPGAQQTPALGSRWKEQGEHTWGKDGSQGGGLVWELHHWEWNPSPSQMELGLFMSLGCDIHSVHLAGTEGKSCQRIPWKDHSAGASMSSLHVNQCVIQPAGEGIMGRKHQAMKCSTFFLINTND